MFWALCFGTFDGMWRLVKTTVKFIYTNSTTALGYLSPLSTQIPCLSPSPTLVRDCAVSRLPEPPCGVYTQRTRPSPANTRVNPRRRGCRCSRSACYSSPRASASCADCMKQPPFLDPHPPFPGVVSQPPPRCSVAAQVLNPARPLCEGQTALQRGERIHFSSVVQQRAEVGRCSEQHPFPSLSPILEPPGQRGHHVASHIVSHHIGPRESTVHF